MPECAIYPYSGYDSNQDQRGVIMGNYMPKIIEGKVSGTGWPIDGHTLFLSLWDYDKHESWHLYDWPVYL